MRSPWRGEVQSLDNEKQCLEYFRGNPVWQKVFEGFWKKYYSYGRFSGTVKLSHLTMPEIEELEGFFRKNFHGQKSVSISSDKFCRALSESRYSVITPERLLELYFGSKPVGKNEQEERRQKQIREVFEMLRMQYENTPVYHILESLMKQFQMTEKEDIAHWKRRLTLASDIYNGLPYRSGRTRYLAVFAAEMTGDPHAFDAGSDGGKILREIVELDLENRGIILEENNIFPAYKKQKGFLSVGILIDEVSNYVMLSGVNIRKGNGELHAGMQGFCVEQDMVQIPLASMVEWKEILCPHNKLFIVENPSVFAMLCEINAGNHAFMCMNGQPRLAGLNVLEVCGASGVEVYYAGDFDPEGLLIAQKLHDFYKGVFHYWHLSVEDYMECRSDRQISAKRLKALDKIVDPVLQSVAARVKDLQTAGYQEGLVKQYQEDILQLR